MLQWEWPKTWSPESKEAIRVAMEQAIREAMAGGNDSQIRGTVSVDELNLGSVPPEIALSGIRVLSAERTAIMVKVRYNGDFSVRLRGLEINLDTIGSSGDEADDNFALPFFCPFEMTLRDVHIDGMVAIEIVQELEENPQWEGTGVPLPAPVVSTQRGGKASDRTRPPRPSCIVRPHGRCGYGVLLGGGGRRAMRAPGALDQVDVSLSSLEVESVSGSSMRSSHPRSGFHSFADILSTRMLVKQRMLKVQLFGDPLKSFSVVSNFASVPGANSKVEGTIRMIIKPAIERLMEEGIVITL
ncbi:hypothetical protein ERJ75_001222200 [Trypanosoma vivax]|uniref:SMP-LTD domain-containing protein n=1 Tax=Trypanosoma vivax (strain Y486) TaxID=1055687 RepID=G0U167_TRYVY|nr:hypothetical protein ERJ75_001222200 [Trypanosoma vivax]CCC49822.1 conserved hypothetical protein [Trypanosoma vivax Y486]